MSAAGKTAPFRFREEGKDTIPVTPILPVEEPDYLMAYPNTQEEMENMVAKLTAARYVVVHAEKYGHELAFAMANRLVARSGENVYQSADFHLTSFPASAAQMCLPSTLIIPSPPNTITWRFEDMYAVDKWASRILELHPKCGGCSRALQKPSETVIRVVAALLPPLEISQVQLPSGQDRLYVNMMYAAAPTPTHHPLSLLTLPCACAYCRYALVDEDGEIHYPKDSQRREISYEPVLEAELRERVVRDVKRMNDNNFPLSAKWYAGEHPSSTPPAPHTASYWPQHHTSLLEAGLPS